MITIPFGKYKGIPIHQMNTPERIRYLYWLRNSPQVWRKLSKTLKKQIINWLR
jgi:uncharacterized protein (DUF3820 family)